MWYVGFMQRQDLIQKNSASKTQKRKRLAILLVVAVVLTQGGYLAWQALRPQPLTPLAAYTLAHSHQERLLPPLAEQLAIPLSPQVCQSMAAKSPRGQVRQVQVRQRPGTHQVDIIFANIAAGETETNYYMTSPYGQLLKSICMKTAPQPAEHAEERFFNERAFWQTWLRAKIKLEGK